jgi:5-methylthioadenosine/S-adenosylhomocysteine deaminase
MPDRRWAQRGIRAEGEPLQRLQPNAIAIRIGDGPTTIMTLDTLIHNAILLTCNPAFDIIPAGWLGIRDSRIEAMGAAGAGPLPPARRVIDARGGIAMPGLVNAHTHLPMTLFRGLADDLPLAAWLHDHIFPAERAVIAPSSVRWGTLLACAEMILSGTTTCCDGYFYEEDVAQAVQTAGLRAVLAQGVIDHPAPGVPDPSGNLLQARRFCRDWLGRADTILPSVFCHSPLTCSRDTLVAAKRFCDDHGLLFQIHAAETRGEADHLRAVAGVSPIAYLDRAGVLDRRTLLAHAVWVDATDIARIAERGAAVAHNPESNLKLASGVAPVAQMLAAGVCVGLGSDGCASNNDMDLFPAMDLAAKLQKVACHDPTVLPARAALRMATIDGARALGLDHRIGSLEPGKQADLIVVDTRSPHLTPMRHPASAAVYSARGSDVTTVMVAGRLLLDDRRLLTLDVERIMQAVNRLSAGYAQRPL